MKAITAAVIWLWHLVWYALGLASGWIVAIVVLAWSAWLAGYHAGRYR